MHFEGSDTVMHTVGFCLCKNKYASYAYNCLYAVLCAWKMLYKDVYRYISPFICTSEEWT